MGPTFAIFSHSTPNQAFNLLIGAYLSSWPSPWGSASFGGLYWAGRTRYTEAIFRHALTKTADGRFAAETTTSADNASNKGLQALKMIYINAILRL